MRKDDVTYHSDGYGRESLPAVSVKVNFWRFPNESLAAPHDGSASRVGATDEEN